MSDPRIVVVVVAVAAAVLVALWARGRERRRAARAALDLSGLEGRVLFFSDAACVRCDIVRAHLEGIGADFTEFAYDRDPESHRSAGVTGVPLVVVRDDAGEEIWRYAGVMRKARLADVLGRHGE